MKNEEQKLDNPVWYSLTETQMPFAVEYNNIKFYKPNYCSFGGFTDLDKTLAGCDQYSTLTTNFYIVGPKPEFSESLKINKELVCNQMITSTPINIEIKETIIELQTNNETDLFNLVNLVQPGYFKKETSQLGSYYGIYKDNQLVAVAGERMKMNTYTEVSAIVTHPEHTGKGYAKQLIAHVTNKILNENKIPYLHVVENNIGAIKLYEKLGFLTRRKISFWNLTMNDNSET